LVSWVSLIALILPSALFLAGAIGLDPVKPSMLVATVVWFAAASTHMWKEE
jgi:hypothetical protein